MKQVLNYLVLLLLIFGAIAMTQCTKDGGLVLLSVEDEIALGLQADSAIRADPEEYPILGRSENPFVYDYFDAMMEAILASDDINYREEFDWNITVINKDVMNAFALPGGRIYFYTGLIKYLENSAQIAGVLAHEIAHVDRRHSNKQITKAYGLDFLLSLLVDENNSEMAQIASDLALGVATLKFSRTYEYEADEYSIKYLLDTDYHPKGIEGFFVKLQNEGHTEETFEFLSTHPSDQNRIDNINSIWEENGSVEGELFQEEYDELITHLNTL